MWDLVTNIKELTNHRQGRKREREFGQTPRSMLMMSQSSMLTAQSGPMSMSLVALSAHATAADISPGGAACGDTAATRGRGHRCRVRRAWQARRRAGWPERGAARGGAADARGPAACERPAMGDPVSWRDGERGLEEEEGRGHFTPKIFTNTAKK